MSWVGGKKALREILESYLPLDHNRYVEVFGGAGWLLFHKAPGPYEVYNDFNGLLVNLYRCVREKPMELIEALRFRLNTREDFDYIQYYHAEPKNIRITKECNIRLAAEFYYLIRTSYASGLSSFGGAPHDFWQDFPHIVSAHRRLGKTVIECQDFGTLIRHYDRPDSVFYLDPPYFGTENLYQNVGKEGFTLDDHVRLRDQLMGIEGRFLLSYNKDPFIFELYDQPGICIVSIDRLHNFRQRYEGGSMFEEYIIANYDLEATKQGKTIQLDLFAMQQYQM